MPYRKKVCGPCNRDIRVAYIEDELLTMSVDVEQCLRVPFMARLMFYSVELVARAVTR
jgi:hypothetical protein